jgi:hypothetical protein
MNKNFDISMVYNVRNGPRVDFAKVHSLNGVYLANQLEIVKKRDSTATSSSIKEREIDATQETLKDLLSIFKENSKVQSLSFQSKYNEENTKTNAKRLDGNIKTMLSYNSGGGWVYYFFQFNKK